MAGCKHSFTINFTQSKKNKLNILYAKEYFLLVDIWDTHSLQPN